MDSEVLSTDDVPRIDLSENEEIPPDHDVRPLADALGMENLRANLWYVAPGEEVGYHAHAEQEEFYYVVAGEFSVKHGRSGETDVEAVGPGDVFAAGPGVGHGYRNVGDDEGVVLAVGAPAVEDPGQDPHELD